MKLQGTVHKYGDHIDTDAIIPARCLASQDRAELASHCMEDIDAAFPKRVKPGDIIVGGVNFGCGSSREHAPIAIAASGVSCVIAKSFARIFYRNCINTGLPILECAQAEELSAGDRISVDLETGEIKDMTTNRTYTTAPFPAFIQSIVDAGGYMNAIRSNRL